MGLSVSETRTRALRQHMAAVRQMFSPKSIQMVEGSVCLRASCGVCARPAKWRMMLGEQRLLSPSGIVGFAPPACCSSCHLRSRSFSSCSAAVCFARSRRTAVTPQRRSRHANLLRALRYEECALNLGLVR
jgi:hypothetical protein